MAELRLQRRPELAERALETVNAGLATHFVRPQDVTTVSELKERYRAGGRGDVALKRRLEDVLETIMAPIRARRAELARDRAYVVDVLRDGSERATATTEAVLRDVPGAFALDA